MVSLENICIIEFFVEKLFTILSLQSKSLMKVPVYPRSQNKKTCLSGDKHAMCRFETSFLVLPLFYNIQFRKSRVHQQKEFIGVLHTGR